LCYEYFAFSSVLNTVVEADARIPTYCMFLRALCPDSRAKWNHSYLHWVRRFKNYSRLWNNVRRLKATRWDWSMMGENLSN